MDEGKLELSIVSPEFPEGTKKRNEKRLYIVIQKTGIKTNR